MRRVSAEEGGGRDLGRSSGVTPRVTHLGLGAAPGACRLEPAAPPGESRPPRRVSIAVPTAPGHTLPQLRLRDVTPSVLKVQQEAAEADLKRLWMENCAF